MNAGPYRLESLLGEGSFSRVFRATRPDEGVARAIKLAKPRDELGPAATPTGVLATGVFAWVTGALLDVDPDASEILRVQFDTLKAIDSPDLVRVRELGADDGHAWYALDLVEGRTLRKAMDEGALGPAGDRAASARIAVELVACLRRLEDDPSFRYHGDLKPENILVAGERVVLIDPGYFGPLADAGGRIADCIVTTPAYYPWLDPHEDVFALGLVLWELLFGFHPLSRSRRRGAELEPRRVGPNLAGLAATIHYGRSYVTPWPDLALPHELDPAMPRRLQETLLKAIRLGFEGGVLELAPGFRTFAELGDALDRDLGEPRAVSETARRRPRTEPTTACPGCGARVPSSAEECPACGRTTFDAAVDAGLLQPAPFVPRWQISTWYGEGAGREAPSCPHCGEQIRSDGSLRLSFQGLANPPWNAAWDGACERCGHRFELTLDQQLHFQARRSVHVRPRNDFHRTFFDEAICLSGVEITVEREAVGSDASTQTVFLSMGELAALLEALQGDLSVCFAQYDWSEDWT